jgi:ABC-type uncharacterized transport system substrate-binding protein
MTAFRQNTAGMYCAAAGFAMLTLSACVTAPVATEMPPPPEPVAEITPIPDDSTASPIPETFPEATPPVVVALPEVTIVLTSRDAAYEDVATELGKHLQNFRIFDLSDDRQPPIVTFRSINDSETQAVIAIGLRAAKSSVAMAQTPVVFSQVFNYQDHDLLNERSRGIASLPPLEAHIAAWKDMDPSLTRIGIIIGHGHEKLITEAEIAAEKYGVELQLRTVQSDRETLYYFNRMIRDIDGFWLFPDNRILSGPVLQKMLAEANRLQVPVAVPNEAILSMGATISFSTVAEDIAATILDVVRQIGAGNIDQVPPLTALSEIRVATNDSKSLQPLDANAETPNGDAQSALR